MRGVPIILGIIVVGINTVIILSGGITVVSTSKGRVYTPTFLAMSGLFDSVIQESAPPGSMQPMPMYYPYPANPQPSTPVANAQPAPITGDLAIPGQDQIFYTPPSPTESAPQTLPPAQWIEPVQQPVRKQVQPGQNDHRQQERERRQAVREAQRKAQIDDMHKKIKQLQMKLRLSNWTTRHPAYIDTIKQIKQLQLLISELESGDLVVPPAAR